MATRREPNLLADGPELTVEDQLLMLIREYSQACFPSGDCRVMI